MIDIYIDDIKIKTFGYDGDKNQLAIENGENKAMLIFDDDVLYQLYILVKRRGEMKGLIPIYNKSEPITVKTANATNVGKVVHGEWIDKLVECNGVAEIKSVCSLCGNPNKQYKPPYCPHCGAKMDKEQELRRG